MKHLCGCDWNGRCGIHADMMRTIRAAAWESGSEKLFRKVWSFSDGYGEPGFIPVQGYDWSGIRDSTPEAVEAMFAVVS